MNPVPSIPVPDWLKQRVKATQNKYKQKDLKAFFGQGVKHTITDIEDIGSVGSVKINKPMEDLSIGNSIGSQ